jgi:hypothetical protein
MIHQFGTVRVCYAPINLVTPEGIMGIGVRHPGKVPSGAASSIDLL